MKKASPRGARSRRPAPGRATWIALAGLAALTTVVYVSTKDSTPEAPPRPAPALAQQAGAPVLEYELVRQYPHDRTAFTQGLLFRDGFLYESTGQYGQSSLRKVDLETGRVLQRRPIDAMYFAEGLAAAGDRLVQLTWQENVAFAYDIETFEPIGTFRYPGEGWGLAFDGQRLIMSDGSAQLRFLDPATGAELGRVTVRDGPLPIDFACASAQRGCLNELEYVNGDVYANVWGSDRIAIIDPGSGRVRAWLDLAGILGAALRRGTEDVLNGIAYDAQGGRLFVTGKNWPALFEIRLPAVPPR